MDFELSEQQEAIGELARQFAREQVAPQARRIDQSAEFSWELHRRLGELGFLGMTAPEAYGGAGADTLSWCLAVEAITKASSAVANGLTLTESMVHYLATSGSEEQKRRYVPALARGEKLCGFCLTEPNAGSDAASLQTVAREEDDGYVLNGQKMFISAALLADFFIVAATVDRQKRSRGIRTFIVEKGAPGLVVGEKLDLLGIRGFGTAPVFFDDCRVPRSAKLGGDGGFRAVMQGLDGAGRLGAASMAIGTAQAAMEDATRYAVDRKQFGQPIFEFQAVHHMLADMSIEIAAARLLVWNAAWRRDTGKTFTKESSQAKTFAGDMCMRNVTNAMQIFGGYSYSKEFNIERHFRDAKIHQIWDGTNQIQRMIIARHLKKEIA